MFQKNKSEETQRNATPGTTIVGGGTVLTGNIESTNDLRIDGVVQGNIACKSKVVIGTEGRVEGNIESEHVDIMGKVAGNIVASGSLHLGPRSVVTGDVVANSLHMEPACVFNGRCRMGKALGKEESNATKPKLMAAS